MTMVNRRTLTMCLANIQTGKVKDPNARTLPEHQCKTADALDKYFNDDGAVNPNAAEHQINAIIFQACAQMELCQAAKGLIHPDHLEAKARVILAHGVGEHAQLDDRKRPL
ncbi:phage antirepressor N-terminal domain-containing protein [Actinomycetaceae bacterium TAE3-ERU4]|nr:phage antirepressor N-terminal domain-containing protein [Actinomycetaceae bacterium TAE3-ERU4]